MRDEQKLKSQLAQLREQYMRETAPKSGYSKSRQSTPNLVQKETQDKVDRSSIGRSPSPNIQELYPPVSSLYQYSQASPVQQRNESSFKQQDSGFNEQLERLKVVQEEIDRKNAVERNETNKIMREILETSNRYISNSQNSSPSFGSKRHSRQANLQY